MRRQVKTFADLHFNLRQAGSGGKGLTLSWDEVGRLVQQLNQREGDIGNG